jgi:hypothetical protein
VLSLVPKSFLDHGPLSKVERRAISRNHQGIYPDDGWPNGLAMKESTRNSSDMQKAKKLTLPQYSVEVSKFLERNDFKTKMTGSALSRVGRLSPTNDLELETRERGQGSRTELETRETNGFHK